MLNTVVWSTFTWSNKVVLNNTRVSNYNLLSLCVTRTTDADWKFLTERALPSWVTYRQYTCCINTLRPRQNDRHFAQTMFSNTFSWMKMYEFRLKFHWSLFLRFQLTICQHWFRYWLGAVQATSHYLDQWWLVYWRIYASLGLSELNLSSRNIAFERYNIYQYWDITVCWNSFLCKARIPPSCIFNIIIESAVMAYI